MSAARSGGQAGVSRSVVATGSGRLGRQGGRLFERCEAREAIVYVPMAVIWETCLLARVGRIHLRRRAQEFFDDLFSSPAYQPLDLAPDQIFAADALVFTRDPFDALIVAAALSLNLPLITRDAAVRRSRTAQPPLSFSYRAPGRCTGWATDPFLRCGCCAVPAAGCRWTTAGNTADRPSARRQVLRGAGRAVATVPRASRRLDRNPVQLEEYEEARP